MKKDNKIKKVNKKKIIIRTGVIALLIFIIYNIISFYTSSDVSIVAHVTSKEITYEFEGIISRDESTININIGEKGIIDPCVSENQMVKKGALIANYYDSNIDDSTKEELNYINQKIYEMKATPVEGMKNKTEQEIENEKNIKIYELIDNASKRDVVKIKNKKNEIINLLDQNEKDDDEISSDESMEKLLEKKEEIEKKYQGKKEEIFSPVHGIYSTSLDGYEDIMTVEKGLEMSVTDFENIIDKTTLPLSGKEVPEIKITDSFKWSISICTDEKTAKNFEIGKKVNIRFKGEKDEPEAVIEYISPIKSGKCIITAVSTEYSDYAMKNRFTDVTFVKEKYKGLFVPVKAIRVIDGVTGVYVRTENTVKYREIEVLYKDDKEAIVKMDNTKSNALLLYDEIIVN